MVQEGEKIPSFSCPTALAARVRRTHVHSRRGAMVTSRVKTGPMSMRGSVSHPPKSRKWSGTPRNLRVRRRTRAATRKFRRSTAYTYGSSCVRSFILCWRGILQSPSCCLSLLRQAEFVHDGFWHEHLPQCSRGFEQFQRLSACIDTQFDDWGYENLTVRVFVPSIHPLHTYTYDRQAVEAIGYYLPE